MLSLLIVGGALVSCAGQDDEGEDDNAADNNQEEQLTVQKDLTFGIVEWPGVTVKTQVVKEVLENLGYNVTIEALTQPILLKGLSTGDIDVFLGAWFETLKSMLQPYLDEGSIVVLGNNLEGTLYKAAVPAYVYDAGVTSLADISDYGEKFGYKYYGIEPGNDGNQIMIDAIKNGTYNLGNWEVLESSTTAMLSQVEKATKDNDWIIFSGWKPHWMNISFDIKYLDDPEGIWGGEGEVGTISKKTLPEDDPNITRFLKQFKLKNEYQSEWILEYSKKGREADEVAKEWVANNVDVVTGWMEGVKTVDGKDAQEAIRNAYQ